MRNFYRYGIAALWLVLMFAACKKVEQPETVALKFYEAVESLDFDTAKAYVAKETLPLFDVLVAVASGREQLQAATLADKLTATVKSIEQSEDETEATVNLQLMLPDSTLVDELSILLQKEEGSWKVLFKN